MEKVIIERIDNLKEFFKEEFASNKEEHRGLKKDMEDNFEAHEKRIRKLEDWRLTFVAKFSVYSAIALTIGSLAGTLIIHWLGKYL